MRKPVALTKAVLINATRVAIQEGARDSIHDHHTLLARLNMFFLQLFCARLQLISDSLEFVLLYVYHQRTTAVAALLTIYKWRYFVVQTMRGFVYHQLI